MLEAGRGALGTTIGKSYWFAWIPILNVILMLNIARKPVWWILLFLIPLVNNNIIIIWMGIAEATQQTQLVGNFAHRSGGKHYPAGLSGLVGLMFLTVK